MAPASWLWYHGQDVDERQGGARPDGVKESGPPGYSHPAGPKVAPGEEEK